MVLPPSSVATACLNASVSWPACVGERVLSKNTNELKTGAPGRFDRHRLVASPSSGACRRRCRRFGFPVRAGKTPFSNGMPRSRAETWIQARAAPGPERASRLRRGSPGLILDPSGGLFSDAARPCQRPAPPLWRKRGTRKSRLETKTENEACSALLRVSGATYPCKTPPTARKIPPVSAGPQLARLGGGWCSLELSGLGKRRSSFWRKSSNRKSSGDSGGFEFRAV